MCSFVDSFLGRSKPAYTPLPIVASHSLNLALCLQCLLLRPPTRTTFLRTILAPQLLLLHKSLRLDVRRSRLLHHSWLMSTLQTTGRCGDRPGRITGLQQALAPNLKTINVPYCCTVSVPMPYAFTTDSRSPRGKIETKWLT